MKKLILLASIIALAPAGSAKAAMIAGFDHNSYVAGFLSTDGATLVDTLDARYSDFDPTFGAGAEAGAFGTLYMDGSFGSTATPLDGSDPYTSTSGSLSSNVTAPVNGEPAGDVPFGSTTVLTSEGVAPFGSEIKMVANAATSVVYSADLSSIASVGDNWNLSFAGQTPIGTATVGIEFSTDGANYVVVGDETLNTVDSTFNVVLGGGPSAQAFIRLTFDANQPFIDNLAIFADVSAVPEPASLALVASGLVALATVRRRRA